MTRKDAVAASFYQRYIQEARDENVVKALHKNTRAFKKLLANIPHKKVDFAYEPGKWTIRTMLRHLIDAERVFAFRALSFARKDPAALPSFNENNWAANSMHTETSWKDLRDEFKAVRKSTELLFATFSDEELAQTGTASDYLINVLALGFVVAGHTQHHMRILKERYL